MKLLRRRSPSLTSLFISCFFITVVIQPTQAKQVTEIQSVQELKRSARTVKEWFAQIKQQNPPAQNQEDEVIQVTSVKANPTSSGVEVVLQTSKGQQLQVVNRSLGNNFIADIPNAQLRLPNSEAFTFRSQKPIAGVSEITVTNFDDNTIRVTVTGEAGVPIVELFDSADEGIIFSVASAAPDTQPQQQNPTPPPREGERSQQTQPSLPSAEGDEPIELVVTGEQDGYTVPEASTATRTDTPLRDIPQSIQVVPQQVIKDQGITRINDAVRNVSGTSFTTGYGNSENGVNIRGFNANSLKDGFTTTSIFTNATNIEQVEVLKGPASVLYGQVEPGGVINYVTKKPLSNPYYAANFTAGSYNYYNGAIDLSGPLTTDKKLLYRLNVSYEDSDSFRDLVFNKVFFISPAFTYKISDRTTLDFAYEYLNFNSSFDRGFPNDPRSFNLPINLSLNDYNAAQDIESHQIDLTLNHQFNDHLQIRSRFEAKFEHYYSAVVNEYAFAEDGQTVLRDFYGGDSNSTNLVLQTDLIAKFKTGSIEHQLLAGLEWKPSFGDSTDFSSVEGYPSINIYNPVYGFPFPAVTTSNGNSNTDTVGIALQDQVTLLPNVKLLVGGRYDFISTDSDSIADISIPSEPQKSGSDSQAFSPRVGIVYQPIEPISLYASYSRSFTPNLGTLRADLTQIEPSRGTQYEVGVKAELFGGRLISSLAAYDIAKTNIPTTDPDNPQYSIALGEVKSRGIEFDIAGEISPGWKVIASAYLNDTYTSKDSNSTIIGGALPAIPSQGASLWTTYEIQKGSLKGLQFGGGIFYVGDRVNDYFDPIITLPSYVRTDAVISYKRDNWRAALNFKNIFNVRYYETNWPLIFPQAPFTLQGTISVEF
ncbi:TonB-dependent siderophore receptor [uncultured Nostoc sp.]|uniref:TonB-dependent siderophore receptor n=1 Tax=uncultured Nostoc sp. TaxID=340711 RepID=UPI00261341A0|nr:TonB-dependent siderophore receptor [uncultured Nostoc sp.]